MSATPAQREAAELALADLEKLRQGVWSQTLATWDASGGSSKEAALKFLEKTAPETLAWLRQRLDVVNGRMTWSTWVDNARELHRSLTEISGYRSEWAMSSVLLNTTLQTGEDIGKGLQQVGAAAKSGATWGVLAALVVLYVAWKVS